MAEKLFIGNQDPNNIKVGTKDVVAIYVGNTKVYPTDGAGYYNCGYGCQYYQYNPGCISCTPS